MKIFYTLVITKRQNQNRNPSCEINALDFLKWPDFLMLYNDSFDPFFFLFLYFFYFYLLEEVRKVKRVKSWPEYNKDWVRGADESMFKNNNRVRTLVEIDRNV